MLITFLLILLLGIILGLLLVISTFWIIKVKCPQCQQLRPLKEITVFNLKQKTLTGQPCLKCQSTTKINIF